MSKTNDTSKLGHAALEGHRALGDTELDAVTVSERFARCDTSVNS
jgi:hypothetical protein